MSAQILAGSRLLDDCRQDRCLARLGPRVRREACFAAAHPRVEPAVGVQAGGTPVPSCQERVPGTRPCGSPETGATWGAQAVAEPLHMVAMR